MQSPSIQEIDEIRKTGYRPQVVGCFLKDKKILFLFKKEYLLWQLPQGGIDNGETAEEAIVREMTEELGNDFVRDIKIDSVVGRDAIEFPRDINSRELKTDEGKEMTMLGKEYFFIALNSNFTELDINKTEFDDYKWLDYEGSLEISEMIYQKGKKRITDGALNLLHESGLL